MSADCKTKTKTKEKRKGHTCRCHMLDHRNLFHAHKLEEVSLISPSRPVVDMASKKTDVRISDRRIPLERKKKRQRHVGQWQWWRSTSYSSDGQLSE